jgi:hypothetical protein
MDTSKLESNGLVGDLVANLVVCLDGIKDSHEKFCQTTNELKSTTNELVKGQEALSSMMEEMLAFMEQSSNMQGGATNSKARHIPFDNLATNVEGSMGVVISQKPYDQPKD